MISRQELAERYQQVMENVAAAAGRSGRQAEDVLVIAVTKYASPDQIRQLIELGHQDLGENRVQQLQQRVAMCQEFIARHRQMPGPRSAMVPEAVRWHMIGHLQRNKVKPMLKLVKLIHSIDSLRVLEEVQTQAQKQDMDVEVLIEVNTAGESTKFGIAPAAAPHLAEQMETMFNVCCRGLMAMAPYSDDPEDSRETFIRTAELFNDMKKLDIGDGKFNILSMGMSNDYQVAIECGANVVRIGSAIFGEPDPQTCSE